MNHLLQASSEGGMGSMLVPFAFMALVFYFMLIRPQGKQRKKEEEMRKNLKRGDRVVTQAGVVAEIKQVRDGGEVVLDLDGKSAMTVLRSSIVQVLATEEKAK
jgi:preprotein translocase subunit YajC